MTWLLLIAVFWLAWANGANDNFKGVATLYGSRTLDYRSALRLATVTTLVGSLLSIVLAGGLIKAFSGKGLVPDELLHDPSLLLAVGAGAAVTVLLATRLGMPTSTTHALTGSLAGVALVIGHGQADFARLWDAFFKPLMISPFLSIGGAALLYLLFRRVRLAMKVDRETCVCVGREVVGSVPYGSDPQTFTAAASLAVPSVTVGEDAECMTRYGGRVAGVSAQSLVNGTHLLSGAAVCFARAVNDTPKIAALLLATGASAVGWKLGLVALAMSVAGLIQARRVAETMSRKITDLNPGQGLTANLVTAFLVLGASRLGVPVSTTHVSCGAIFGIGAASRSLQWKTLAQIAVTWLTTIPMGTAIGAALYYWLQR